MNGTEHVPLTGVRKAAILLSVLGEEVAAPILRKLSEDDLQRVTDEVANMGPVPFGLTLDVLEEYQQMMTAQDYIAIGGHEVAIRFLLKAFGETGAKNMVQRLMRAEESPMFKMEALKKADPQQLARFLVGEHPQTKAMVLGHLEAKQASALLMKMDPEDRADCVRRSANLGQVSPEIASKVTAALNRRLRSVGGHGKRADYGLRNVADMMNRLDSISAREILESIEHESPKLASGIRDLMFTFEDFGEVPDQMLQEVMNVVDRNTLSIALKGASEDLRNHFYRRMSSRAVEMMKEDLDMMGPTRARDIAKAQSEVVAIGRKLESEGKIVLKSEEEDDYVV